LFSIRPVRPLLLNFCSIIVNQVVIQFIWFRLVFFKYLCFVHCCSIIDIFRQFCSNFAHCGSYLGHFCLTIVNFFTFWPVYLISTSFVEVLIKLLNFRPVYLSISTCFVHFCTLLLNYWHFFIFRPVYSNFDHFWSHFVHFSSVFSRFCFTFDHFVQFLANFCSLFNQCN